MIQISQRPEASSERLEKLLTESGNYKSKGVGLTEEVKVIAGVSYTTARKWLYEDALPRTSDERIRVASLLKIDLLYWEYGYSQPTELVEPFETDYLFHMKVANKVMEIIHEGNLKLIPDKVIEIELLAIEFAQATNSHEPDVGMLKSLIKLAT